jgi:hypothetical protein
MLKALLCGAGIVPLVLAASVRAADAVELKPNAVLRFEFPDLPDTLASMLGGKKQPAVLTAQLPENYTPDGKFPICVYLQGGNGGDGEGNGRAARNLVGPRDFICVSLPLFKHDVDPLETLAGGMVISMGDQAVISHAYQVMLQKLLAAVPNITPEGSALGGFSNGAHTTGVLLAGQDPFIYTHFRSFFMIDGGFEMLAANLLQKSIVRPCRFLVLVGDKPVPSARLREAVGNIAQSLDVVAHAFLLNYTTVTMHGYGHEDPPEYLKMVGAWIRGEKLPAEPAKN